MTNYPDRQNFPKLLEEGWDKVSDESVSLPIVWELEKLSDNAGYWTSMKYENEDGTVQEVLQFEDTPTTSTDITNVMSIDTFTVNNKEFKVCDVPNIEAVRAASAEGTDDYKEFVRHGSEWNKVYYMDINNPFLTSLENDPYFEYGLDYDNWVVYPLRLKAGINWDTVLKNVGTNLFEMADMKYTYINTGENVEDYWVDWSQFDFTSILQYPQFNTIRLPFNSWNFTIPQELRGFNIVLLDPKQYGTLKNCTDYNLYNSFDYKYRYAIDYEKHFDNIADEVLVLNKNMVNNYSQLDLIGGKSYQFDRTNPGLTIDLATNWDYESAVSRNNVRLELNIYGKMSQNFLTIPAKDGMVKDYKLDFNIYGATLEDISQADKDNIEYLKTYCGCTFKFFAQPKEENTNEWEKIEDLTNAQSFTIYQNDNGTIGIRINKNSNDLEGTVLKDEYLNNGELLTSNQFTAGAFNDNGTGAYIGQEFIVEGNSLISGRKTINGMTKRIKTDLNNLNEFGMSYYDGLRDTRNLRKMSMYHYGTTYDLTIPVKVKQTSPTSISGLRMNDTSVKLTSVNIDVTTDEELTSVKNISLGYAFRNVSNVKDITINIQKNDYIKVNSFSYTFNGCKAENVYLNGFSDDYFSKLSPTSSSSAKFVSSDCSMTFHVENSTQKQGLENAIIKTLGITDMSETAITVVYPIEDASLNWEYTTDDTTNTITLTKYIGTNPEVNIKNTYSVDGTVYENVKITKQIFQDTTTTSVSTENNIKTTNEFYQVFYNCSYLVNANINYLNMSNALYIANMFYNCKSLTSLDLSGWNTSNVIEMSDMFKNCSNLTSLDLSGWDVSSVTNMSSIFYNCKSLTSLDLSGWNTSSVTNMRSMFDNCSSLTSLDLSGWNVSNVTNMNNMFFNCKALTSLDLSGWNTSNVTNMSGMFRYCSSLTSLDLSGWDVSSVTNMNKMFADCSNLETIYVKDEATKTKLKTSASVPSGCQVIVGPPPPEDASINWEYTTNDTDNSITLTKYIGSSSDVIVKNKYTANGTIYNLVKIGSETSNAAPFLDKKDIIKNIKFETDVKLMNRLADIFYLNLDSLDIDEADATDVTDLFNSFRTSGNIRTLNIGSWAPTNLTSLNQTFWGSSFNTIDMHSMDLTNVTEVNNLFLGCSKLRTVYVKDENAKTKITSSGTYFPEKSATVIIGAPPAEAVVVSDVDTYSLNTMSLDDEPMVLNDIVDAVETTQTTTKKRGRPKKTTTEITTNNDEV